MGKIDHRGLEPGKAHIQLVTLHARARQVIYAALALLCQIVHRLSAGIRQSQNARSFVEALPRGIVARCAEKRKIGIGFYIDQQRVAARHAQRQKRRLQLRKRQIVRRNVTADMVDRDQGHTQRVGDGLGEIKPHQHRADQSRRVSRRDGADLLSGDARVPERLLRQRGDRLHMPARRDLRHHAAIERVHVRLRQYGVG